MTRVSHSFPSTLRARLAALSLLLLCLLLMLLPGLSQAQGKRRAVVVGVAGYRFGYVSLDYSGDDARRVGTALKKLGFAVNVLAADAEAGAVQAVEVITALQNAAQKSQAGDTLLFFFAGHGSRHDDQDYLLLSDSNPDDFANTALSVQSLAAILNGCEATQRVLVIDACRNSSKRAEGKSGFADDKLDKDFTDRMDQVLRQNAKGTAQTAILYACSPGQASKESDGEQAGIFTQRFVAALESGAGGKQAVTMGLVYDYVVQHMPVSLAGKQTPLLFPSQAATLLLRPSAVPDVPRVPNNPRPLPQPANNSDSFHPNNRRNNGSNSSVGNAGKMGRTRRNPKDGAEMVFIPAGPFLMGDDDSTSIKAVNPRHTMTLSGYWMYKNLVTVGMYKQFCQQTGRKMPGSPDFNPNWSKADHPMVKVSWDDATAYAKWAGVSLPTEAQWEKAARGTDGRKYPWGNDWDAIKLWSSDAEKRSGTAAVGSYPAGASPYGCLDMAGNVAQWCADWYKVLKHTPGDFANGTARVVRGASWGHDGPFFFRASLSGRFELSERDNYLGFRCASGLN